MINVPALKLWPVMKNHLPLCALTVSKGKGSLPPDFCTLVEITYLGVASRGFGGAIPVKVTTRLSPRVGIAVVDAVPTLSASFDSLRRSKLFAIVENGGFLSCPSSVSFGE